MHDTINELAPAKINLALHITGRRSNGFHNLESLVIFASVADELIAQPAQEDTLTITGPFADALSVGQSNLVQKAVAAFRAQWPDAVPHGVAIELRKNLPIAAGIGGGSADAAAALRLMVQFAGDDLDTQKLFEIAKDLGADVPVCLMSRPCLIGGIGELIHPLDAFPSCHVVLVNPLIPIPTADIFRRLNNHENEGLPLVGELVSQTTMLALWLEETRNDLQSAAVEIVPEIEQVIDGLRETKGSIMARMSGSGATVFGLYGSSAEAHQAAHDMRAAWPDYWVAAAPLYGAG